MLHCLVIVFTTLDLGKGIQIGMSVPEQFICFPSKPREKEVRTDVIKMKYK